MEIKYLTIENYEEMVELWKIAGLNSIRLKGRDSKEAVEKQMKMFPKGFIGAFLDGKLVGVVVVTHDGRKGWINRLAVHPSYRRKGIASRLIEEAEKVLREDGISVFCALVEDWNHASMKLFEKCGYKKHSEIVYFSKRDSEDA